MNQRQLLYFLEVYHLKSIKKAATKLIISPQGISKTILALEQELDISLFTRTKNGLEPTKQAMALKPHAEKILEEFSTLQEKSFFTHTKKDFLKILSTPGVLEYLTANFIKDFQTAYPKILLNFTETTDKAAIAELNSGEIDMAILSGTVDTTIFSCQYLFKNYHCFIVSTKNPLAKKEKLSLKDFKNQALILKGREQTFYNTYQNQLIKNGIQPNIILETTVNSIIADMAEQNLAIGGSLDYIAFKNKRPHTVILPMDGIDNVHTVYLAEKYNNTLSSQSLIFKNFLLTWLEKHRSELFHWNRFTQ